MIHASPEGVPVPDQRTGLTQDENSMWEDLAKSFEDDETWEEYARLMYEDDDTNNQPRKVQPWN